MRLCLLIPLVTALGLSACAPSTWLDDWPNQKGGRFDDARCEDALAEGVSQQTAEARDLARAGAKQQVDDVRGNLLEQGLHQIRIVAREVHCKPHTLGLGLVKCTAVIRMCGR